MVAEAGKLSPATVNMMDGSTPSPSQAAGNANIRRAMSAGAGRGRGRQLAPPPGVGNPNVDIGTPDRRRSRPPVDTPGSGGSGEQQPPAARLRSTIPDFRAAGFGVTEGDVNNFRMQIQAVVHNMQDHFSAEIARNAARVDVLVRSRLDDRMLTVENAVHDLKSDIANRAPIPPTSDEENEKEKKGKEQYDELKREVEMMKVNFEQAGTRLAEATARTQEALGQLAQYDVHCKAVIEENFVGVRAEFDQMKGTFTEDAFNKAIGSAISHSELKLECTIDVNQAQNKADLDHLAQNLFEMSSKVLSMESERDQLKKQLLRPSGAGFPIGSGTIPTGTTYDHTTINTTTGNKGCHCEHVESLLNRIEESGSSR